MVREAQPEGSMTEQEACTCKPGQAELGFATEDCPIHGYQERAWRAKADAAYEEARRSIEYQRAWREMMAWWRRNWKLLLGIVIGYILAGAAMYLDQFFHAAGITR
jgi:hypothetical protein